jgi:hypothetical protein
MPLTAVISERYQEQKNRFCILLAAHPPASFGKTEYFILQNGQNGANGACDYFGTACREGTFHKVSILRIKR